MTMSALDSVEPGSVVKNLCEVLRPLVNLDDLRSMVRDRERMEHLLRDENVVDHVKECIATVRKSIANPSESKNKELALGFKDQGNSAFGTKIFAQALHFYTQSILRLPSQDTKEIAICLANRSAAFFHLGQIRSAVQDAKEAFRVGYPKDLHYKLYERLGRCYLEQGNLADAKKNFKQALSAASDASSDASKITKIRASLQNLIKSASNLSTSTNAKEERVFCPEPVPQVAGEKNKWLKCASSRVSAKSSASAGRFMIANQDIQPGDVILVQQAYVSALLPEYYHRQCYRCLTPTTATVPCSVCASVSFCSSSCRDAAFQSFHKHECQVLQVLVNSGISITCLMAFRLLLQADANQLRQRATLIDTSQAAEAAGRKAGDSSVEANQEYRADDTSLIQLVTHRDRRSAEDIFHRTVMSLFLVCLADMGKFFGSKNETSDEAKLDAGTMLLHSLQSLQFNAHEISAWDPVAEQSMFIGGGLFLTLALFNHSCNPSIVRYFVNDTVVVRAIRTIYKGEEVTENYGPLFTQTLRSERRLALEKQYWFTCECLACKQDWPTFEKMAKDTNLTFRCTFCHSRLGKSGEEASLGLLLQCGRCSRPTNILKSLKTLQDSEGKYVEAVGLLSKGREKAALGVFLQNITLFDSVLSPPFRDYHMCQEAARKCFLALGNRVGPTVLH